MEDNNRPSFESVKSIYQSFINKSSILSTEMFKGDQQLQTSDGYSEAINDKQYDQRQEFQDFQYDTHDFNDYQLNEAQEDADYYSTESLNKTKTKRRQKDRKIRTTITLNRLEQMNKIFKEYQQQKDKGRNPSTNLKEIGHKLQLGYSTVLHKFRQFRQNKVVKGGVLLESLQKRRRYKKSTRVQKYIELALKERPFYTAVQLAKYIFRRFGKSYSRSIISRHLTEMGYSFNNIKPFPLQKNTAKYIEARKLFVKIIESYVQEDADMLFIDQVAFSKNLFTRYFAICPNSAEEKKSTQHQSDYVSLIISANSQKIFHYQIVEGFLRKQHFCLAVKETKKLIDLQKKYSMSTLKSHVLLTDIHKIHYDKEGSKANETSINKLLKQIKLRRFFLPPGSPQLNPLESLFSTIRERLNKQGICSQEVLKQKLTNLMPNIFKQPTNVYFKQFKVWMDKAKYGQNF